MRDSFYQFAVIVIGAGHAGCEAAHASARMGCKTLLLTQNLDTIGHLSCNPSIGGIGKSHLVMEVDAMGGQMAINTDKSGIQFRILNRSKGPAVRAVRAQADRTLYKTNMRSALEALPNLTIFQQSVEDVLLQGDRIIGVKTQLGLTFHADAVVLTSGTFLDGLIHIGEVHYAGGRAGDSASIGLSHRFRELKLPMGRLKTGTPPRLDGRTINLSSLPEQHSDNPLPVYSYRGNVAMHPTQKPCYTTHTTSETGQIIRDNLHRSPLYGGTIKSTGPRYCPSIEDKIVKFADREEHPIFLEPEGLNTHEIYPNGISTSLPFDVQERVVRSIPGMENTRIIRPGYAIEYDYFDPRHLRPTLETKSIQGLFFAGQINGTTGYEEAAAQGLLAGANAGLLAKGEPPLTLSRHESYIGVMVDDLIHRGITEPYRMFTSRAEYRLFLRSDNADLRLAEIAYRIGLIDEAQWAGVCQKKTTIEKTQVWLKQHRVNPLSITDIEGESTEPQTLYQILKRPSVTINLLIARAQAVGIEGAEAMALSDSVALEITETEVKYEGYIARQQEEAERMAGLAALVIPNNTDFREIAGLSNEIRDKLMQTRPNNIAEAKAISGMTPAALGLLQVHLKRKSPSH